MIPNLAIFFKSRLSAKCEADPDFRNSQVVVSALRFINLVFLSGLGKGLDMKRHGVSPEIFADLQRGSLRFEVFEKAFARATLLECYCDLYQFDHVRVEVAVMDNYSATIFKWTALFDSDGSGDIVSSQTLFVDKGVPSVARRKVV